MPWFKLFSKEKAAELWNVIRNKFVEVLSNDWNDVHLFIQ